MAKVIIASFEEFARYAGKEIGVSEYLKITQERINQFAAATLDHQWIHTDPSRAAAESPFGSTIAHGYLVLSVVPHLWEQIADIRNLRMQINYGIEKLKFNQPVPAGAAIRLRVGLESIVNLRGVAKATLDVSVEIRDSAKAAFTATLLFLYHFK